MGGNRAAYSPARLQGASHLILLQQHNVLFLKPRKVAGTSFEMALSRFAGRGDIITPILPEEERERIRRGYAGKRNYRYRPWELTRRQLKPVARELRYPYKFYNHTSAHEARERLAPGVFDKALKVSIVRDPFDVLVSQFYNQGHANDDPAAFANWARTHSKFVTVNEKQYYCHGEYVVDHMIRYEHIAEDVARLEALRPGLAGLGETFASFSAKAHFRPSNTGPQRMFAGSDGLVETVRFLAAPVCERFGYDVPR